MSPVSEMGNAEKSSAVKALHAELAGLIASFTVAAMAIAISYVKCFVAGVCYNFAIALPLAMKAGVVIGGFIFVLALIGTPRRGPL